MITERELRMRNYLSQQGKQLDTQKETTEEYLSRTKKKIEIVPKGKHSAAMQFTQYTRKEEIIKQRE